MRGDPSMRVQIHTPHEIAHLHDQLIKCRHCDQVVPVAQLSELQEVKHCALDNWLLKPRQFDNLRQQDNNHLEHLLLALPRARQVDEKVAKRFLQAEHVSPVNVMPVLADQVLERGCCDESQVVLSRVFEEIADRLQIVQVVHVGFQLTVSELSLLMIAASTVKRLAHLLKPDHQGMLLVLCWVVWRH